MMMMQLRLNRRGLRCDILMLKKQILFCLFFYFPFVFDFGFAILHTHLVCYTHISLFPSLLPLLVLSFLAFKFLVFSFLSFPFSFFTFLSFLSFLLSSSLVFVSFSN